MPGAGGWKFLLQGRFSSALLRGKETCLAVPRGGVKWHKPEGMGSIDKRGTNGGGRLLLHPRAGAGPE